MVEITISHVFKVIYFIYWGILYSYRFILLINFFKTKDAWAFYITSEIIDLLSITILFSIHGFVILKSSSIKNPEKQKGVRNFAIIYFISLAVFNLNFYITDCEILQFILSFAYVMPPLIYLYFFLKRFYREHSGIPADSVKIDEVFSRYNISNREQEIIRLISKGKTNNEIADILYVSLQTVKQHTYNIYRKLKVKNRIQLTNFIRNATNGDSN